MLPGDVWVWDWLGLLGLGILSAAFALIVRGLVETTVEDAADAEAEARGDRPNRRREALRRAREEEQAQRDERMIEKDLKNVEREEERICRLQEQLNSSKTEFQKWESQMKCRLIEKLPQKPAPPSDTEVATFLRKSRLVSIGDISTHFQVSIKQVHSILTSLQDSGTLPVYIDTSGLVIAYDHSEVNQLMRPDIDRVSLAKSLYRLTYSVAVPINTFIITQKSIGAYFGRPSDQQSQTKLPRIIAPLAERMRPKTPEDYVAESPSIQTLLRLPRLPSLILYGVPGSGKSSLALLLAEKSGAKVVKLSAVTASIADVKEVVAQARDATVLFLDEIHRFNKAQQDYLLPHVEKGTVTLIGATTENPFFSVNKALLSRCQLVKVPAHSQSSIAAIIDRAIEVEGIVITDEAKQRLVNLASGDARTALNLLEAATLTGKIPIESQDFQPFLDLHGGSGLNKTTEADCISALQKSIRGSEKDAALLYLAYLLENGQDPLYIARRIARIASEDVGLADPFALVLATAAYTATQQTGMPECSTALTEAVVYLCNAAKSNACELAYTKARDAVKAMGNDFRVPPNISVWKQGYVYTNQPEIKQPSAFEGVQRYLPVGFEGEVFPRL